VGYRSLNWTAPTSRVLADTEYLTPTNIFLGLGHIFYPPKFLLC
jgi:hypothetical protein